MNHHVTILCLLAIIALLSSCRVMEKKQQAGAAVELNGHYLYRSTLDSLTLGLSPEDSTRVVQQYISQWAKDILIYDQAKKRTDERLERLVGEYRQSLYVAAYEDYLIDRRMPKTVEDSVAENIYTRMPDRFTLDESIVRGMIVIVPNDAPALSKLKNYMAKEALDDIEKYAYQNAAGYELFLDKWLTVTDIMTQIPIDRADLETRLKTTNQISTADSLKTYILQVSGKHLRGTQMPLDYARPLIEKIVLGERQTEFLLKERERLYNEAIRKKEIVFF